MILVAEADDLHRRATELDGAARLLDLAGKHDAARERFGQAAELEERAADAIGIKQPRTRGILRVGAVSLWMQAHRFERAAAVARRYLAEPLGAGFHRELAALLARIDALSAAARRTV